MAEDNTEINKFLNSLSNEEKDSLTFIIPNKILRILLVLLYIL